MDSMMAVEIKQTLERDFDIFLTPHEIANLTFAKLNKISNTNVNNYDKQHENNLNADKEAYVIKLPVGIVKDEDFVSEICCNLSTKNQNTTTEVFLIPGIDGCGTVFRHLAADIKFSATSLHYNTNNIDATDIMDTTDRIINISNRTSNFIFSVKFL
ncbi:uncharacterized protein LOC118645637 [Monomorium pharaonis]|uniref:uncharacterized protein LOC118645637 n=1 Tax=Monomorium pharaonis TaxID=307658 RepID=UPI00174762CC|nr:uncharacterized protein LOC118645637 [Monomorium pharaonis]